MVSSLLDQATHTPLLLHPGVHKQYECHTPTEEMVCMSHTVPQHIDSQGHKLEDDAGTGECDSLGG